jgi:hypothetical protein
MNIFQSDIAINFAKQTVKKKTYTAAGACTQRTVLSHRTEVV